MDYEMYFALFLLKCLKLWI